MRRIPGLGAPTVVAVLLASLAAACAPPAVTPDGGDAARDASRLDVTGTVDTAAPTDERVDPDAEPVGEDVALDTAQDLDTAVDLDATTRPDVARLDGGDASRTDAARADTVVPTVDARTDASTQTRHQSYIPPALRPTSAARLVVMGDSISAGAGASTASRRYMNLLAQNDDARWPAEMATDLASRFGTAVPVVNVAVGGSTTSAIATSQLDALRTRLGAVVRGHTIVVLTSGGNDFTGALRALQSPVGQTLTDAIANLRTMTAFFRDATRFPDGASIYVAAVYDPTDGTGSAATCAGGIPVPMTGSMLDTWRTRYIEFGTASNVAIVDALGHFRGHGFHYNEPANPYYQPGNAVLWFADCVHPNDVGHNEMRRLFFEAIDRTYVAR